MLHWAIVVSGIWYFSSRADRYPDATLATSPHGHCLPGVNGTWILATLFVPKTGMYQCGEPPDVGVVILVVSAVGAVPDYLSVSLTLDLGKYGMKRFLCLGLLLLTPLSWAANKMVTIDIGQMNCPLCVISINQALRSTDGVIKAKASLKTHQAQVIVPDNFDNQRLLSAIAKTGFTGQIHAVAEAQ